CVWLLFGFFLSPRHAGRMNSADVAAIQMSFGLYRLSESQFIVFMLILAGSALLTWLIGLISAFFLWRPGIYIFFVSVCARLIIEHFDPFIRWGWYGAVEALFELVIVALALFGPAKHLFQRRREAMV